MTPYPLAGTRPARGVPRDLLCSYFIKQLLLETTYHLQTNFEGNNFGLFIHLNLITLPANVNQERLKPMLYFPVLYCRRWEDR